MGRTKARGGAAAERLFAKWIEGEGVMPGGYMRAMRTGKGKWTVRHDFLNCLDFLIPGFRLTSEGLVAEPDRQIGVQITTEAGVSVRKRKIEARDWGSYWQLFIIVHRPEPCAWGVYQLDTPSVGGFSWSEYNWRRFDLPFVLKETERRMLG